MKKSILLLLSFLIVNSMSFGQSYSFSASPNATIPDDDPWVDDGYIHGVESQITVSGIPPTAEIDYVIVNINHPYDGDLDIYLSYYDTRIELSTDNGSDGDNYTNTKFIMSASTPITSGAAPFTGDFIPEQALPDFNETNNPNGVWTLNVCDDASSDVGTFVDWTIVFKPRSCPANPTLTDEYNWNLSCTTDNDTIEVQSPDFTDTYPSLYFQFEADGNGDETNNTIGIRANGTLIYTSTVQNNNRYTVYFTSPGAYLGVTYSVDVSNSDGTTTWEIYDGNGVSHTSGTVTNSSVTDVGGCTAGGSVTWSISPAVAGLHYWESGRAFVDPSELGPGTYTVTYDWDNGGTGAYHCTSTVSHTVTVTNPFNSDWTVPSPVCESGSVINLNNQLSGSATTGGSWSGNGVTTPNFNPDNLSGNTSVTYWVGNDPHNSGCYSSTTHDINVIVPAVNATSNSPVCEGDNIILNETGGVATSWIWDGPVNPADVQSPTVSNATSTSAGTYNVTVTDANGCEAYGSTTVTVNAKPTVNVSASPTAICVGNSSVIDASGSTGNGTLTFQWDNSVSSAQQTVSPTTTTTYNVTVTDANCSNTGNVTVTVNPLPNIFAGDDDSTPYNSQYTFSNASPSGLASYSWTPADSLVNPSILNAQTVALHTTNEFILEGTDNNGCSNTDTVVISVIGGPLSVNITANPNDTICLGENVTLTALVSGGGTTDYHYNWTSNPAGTYGDTNIINLGQIAQTTTFYLEVTENANVAHDTIVVVVNQPPVINSVDVSNLQCYNDSTGAVNISATGSQPLSYSINDGIDYYQNNGAFTGLSASSGLITVVKDVNGCYAYGDTVNVTEPPVLDARIDSIANATCNQNNGVAVLTTTGGTPGYTYTFSSGTAQDSVNTGLYEGDYVATVTDANSCTDTVHYHIQNFGGGTASILNTQNATCYGYNDGAVEVAITNGTPIYNYYILYGTDTIVSYTTADTSFAVDTLISGSYTAIISESIGCSTTLPFTISQPEPLAVTDTAITNPECFGYNTGSIMLTVTGGTPAYNFSWSNGSTDTINTNLTAGAYDVTISDVNSCSLTITGITLTQPDSLNAYITAFSNLACNGDSSGNISVTAEGGTSPYTYQWSNGMSGENISQLQAGQYIVTATDRNNCSDTAIAVITEPEAIILLDTVYYENHYGNIMVTPVGGASPYSYSWNNGASTSEINHLNTGSYTVTVTDANNCSVSGSYEIEVPLEIPSVITPNSDGKNDKFKITGIESYENVKIAVFNRWGDSVYEFDGKGTSYLQDEWDGTINGKELPLGSYVYTIELTKNNDKQTYTGTITIVR